MQLYRFFSSFQETSNEKQGLDNVAYDFGSQTELSPASRVTLKLPGLTSKHQAHIIKSSLISLNGVLGISLSLPRKLAKVDYETSVITSKDIALELQTAGFSVESAVYIRVGGIHCQSCVQAIEEQIGELPGVSHIQVSLQDGVALIVFEPFFVTQQVLRDRIEDMGFDATFFTDDSSRQDISYWEKDTLNPPVQVISVWITGMTCNSCVQSIEGRMSEMVGLQSIAVSLKEGKGMITFDPSLTDPEQLRMAVEDMGFDASLEGRCQIKRLLLEALIYIMLFFRTEHESLC